MDDRPVKLMGLSSAQIDEIAENGSEYGFSEPERVAAFRQARSSIVTNVFPSAIKEALPGIEKQTDGELLRSLRSKYGIARCNPAKFSDPNFIATKINHGFWEHLAFLLTENECRASYRDVNLKMRQRHYTTSDFLPVLMGCCLDLMSRSDAHFSVSCITGIRSFEQLFGQHWINPHQHAPKLLEMTPSRRGAVKGLLAFAHLAERVDGFSEPLGVYDSFDINQSFNDKTLLDALRSRSHDKTLCLIMGPPQLSVVRIAKWPGPQAFLAVSPTACMAQWAFHLANLEAVLHRAERAGLDVVICFQGAVLGPIVADYLCSWRKEQSTNVAFVDLGRLLDLTFETDLTSTGSPLPDGRFDSKGQLDQAEPSHTIYAEF